MDTPEDSESAQFRCGTSGIWKYLALAFGFSWIVWILLIKLHVREEFLNIGSAGPAIAAIVLSRDRHAALYRSPLRRSAAFCLLLLPIWIILCLHSSWGTNPDLRFTLNPWLIGPVLFPAWIISGVLSGDVCVRGLVKRLVYVTPWSLVALLFFPAILLIPAFAAYTWHLPLVRPERHGSPSVLLAAAGVLFLYNLLFVAVLEEPGWRGFLLDRLQWRLSPLLASLAVWLPWALWHAPLDYFRPERFSLMMYLQIRVIFLIPISIILTWLYNRSGRSIQATVIFHASMNTFPFVLPYFAPGLALLFIIATYAVIADRMWRSKYASEEHPTAVTTAVS